LRPDAEVDINVREGAIVIAPVKPPPYTLGDLLSRVNARNLHSEDDVVREAR